MAAGSASANKGASTGLAASGRATSLSKGGGGLREGPSTVLIAKTINHAQWERIPSFPVPGHHLDNLAVEQGA